MSEQIFEQYVDDYGNVSIRVSREFVVFTRDEAEQLRKRFDQLEAENPGLREERDCVGMAAYEVGYKNGSVHYELEHCPACKNVADLQEALEENARLRSCLSDDAENAQMIIAENAKLRSMRDTWQENDAKLRELVADLWTHCPADRYYCALCEYGNDDGSECKLADRMRELGIEVDG